MKIKKLKRTRKALLHLQTVHGIRPPYTVLVDGTFIQASIVQRIAIKDELEKVLGAKVIVAVTESVVAELRALGEPFEAAAIVAKRLQRISIPSPSDTRILADVIVHAVSGGNPMKLFVATEDVKLQARLRKLSGVPLVRIARGSVVLEGAADRAAGEAMPQPKRALSPADRQTLRSLKRKRGPAAPNPLSCKPRKRAAGAAAAGTPTAPAAPKEGSKADEGGSSSKSRKRKRVRRKSKAGSPTAPALPAA